VKKPSDFGRYLRVQRVSRNLTQVELGAKLSVSGSHISAIELGTALPTRDVFLGIIRVFDIPLTDHPALKRLAYGSQPICFPIKHYPPAAESLLRKLRSRLNSGTITEPDLAALSRLIDSFPGR
jgi:transcriptional regulator with XRE-family HTH domain